MMKNPTAEQVTIWYFSTFFVSYGLPSLIIVNADGVFLGFLNIYVIISEATSACSEMGKV